ncbi:MAG: YgeY family selenium metabolism-linked hydrolase [Desulfobacterales bacterium]
MSFNEIDLAQQLVQIPGLSGAEGEVADRVEDAMNALGFRDVYRDELGNVVGFVGPQAEKTALLFDAHMDVVPAAGEWRMDPFGGEIVDGRLYGRGSTDMKGALAAVICGAAAAAKSGRLSRQVAVSATVLEETLECAALGAVVESVKPEQVVICEPSNLAIILGQKGRAEILLTVEGIPAHAAFPACGKNPILLAAKALDALEKIELPEDPFIGRAILVATDIISDPYPSISLIPPKVTVRFDRRILPGETEEIILEQIIRTLKSIDDRAFSVSVTRDSVKAYTGKVIEAPRLFEAWKVKRDIPLVKAAEAGVIAAGIEPRFGSWGFCTNGSGTAGKRKIPTIGLGPGIEDDAHIADESISVEEIRKAKIVYEHLVLSLATQ